MPTADTYARFHIHPTHVSGKYGTSTAVYEDRLLVEVFVKGSQNTSNSRPKTDQDEIDYSAEWKAYVNNEEITQAHRCRLCLLSAHLLK